MKKLTIFVLILQFNGQLLMSMKISEPMKVSGHDRLTIEHLNYLQESHKMTYAEFIGQKNFLRRVRLMELQSEIIDEAEKYIDELNSRRDIISKTRAKLHWHRFMSRQFLFEVESQESPIHIRLD